MHQAKETVIVAPVAGRQYPVVLVCEVQKSCGEYGYEFGGLEIFLAAAVGDFDVLLAIAVEATPAACWRLN